MKCLILYNDKSYNTSLDQNYTKNKYYTNNNKSLGFFCILGSIGSEICINGFLLLLFLPKWVKSLG